MSQAPMPEFKPWKPQEATKQPKSHPYPLHTQDKHNNKRVTINPSAKYYITDLIRWKDVQVDCWYNTSRKYKHKFIIYQSANRWYLRS